MKAVLSSGPCAKGSKNNSNLPTTDTPYTALASEMNTSEGALKVAIHRLRKRYRELVRQEIADTVADPAEVESELRYLAAVLSKK
jgi:hypothetical protein